MDIQILEAWQNKWPTNSLWGSPRGFEDQIGLARLAYGNRARVIILTPWWKAHVFQPSKASAQLIQRSNPVQTHSSSDKKEGEDGAYLGAPHGLNIFIY